MLCFMRPSADRSIRFNYEYVISLIDTLEERTSSQMSCEISRILRDNRRDRISTQSVQLRLASGSPGVTSANV